MQQKNKKASEYSVSRNKIQLNEIVKVCDAHHRSTNEVWEIRIIDGNKIKQCDMECHLQFYEEFLFVMRDNPNIQNIAVMNEIFFKEPETFIVLEKPDITFVELVAKGPALEPEEIDNLVCDVATGVLEIYMEKFYTRSLRPEHIVKVANVWKIAAVVKDETAFPFQCQFTWNLKYASPEEREHKGQIPEQQIDEQIVWQLGIIGLYAILGNEFKYDQINESTDIPWSKVKQAASQSLFEFLTQSLKTKYESRISLREMFELQLFRECAIEYQNVGFLSQSKFYQANRHSLSSSGKQLPDQQSKLWMSIKQDVSRFKLLREVDKYAQQLPFLNSFDCSLIKFLSYRLCYEKLEHILEKMKEWIKGNSIAQNYRPLRLWVKELEESLSSIKQQSCKHYRDVEGISFIHSSVKELRNIEVTEILQKDMNHHKNLLVYWKLAGNIYTNLSRDFSGFDESRDRAICYYSLCAVINACHQSEKFEQFNQFSRFKQPDQSFDFCEFVAKAPINALRRISQQLVKANFRTVGY